MCVRKSQELVERDNCRDPDRRHRLVRSRRHAAEARRVECRLPLARQRRRPAHGRAVRAAILPRQYVGADGRAHARALSQGRAREEVHRHCVRCRLGPIQQCRLRGADQGGRQGPGRQDLRSRRQQGLFHLHHQDPAVGRARLLRGAAGRRGAGVLLAGRPVRARAARAVLHRDRGAGRHQGARQGFARPGRLVALSRHLRHSGKPRLPLRLPGRVQERDPGLDRRRDVSGADDPVRRHREGGFGRADENHRRRWKAWTSPASKAPCSCASATTRARTRASW